jgi:hypothetical protein
MSGVKVGEIDITRDKSGRLPWESLRGTNKDLHIKLINGILHRSRWGMGLALDKVGA